MAFEVATLEESIPSQKIIERGSGSSELSLAERVGFEPTVELPRQQFSRLPDSAALAPLRSLAVPKLRRDLRADGFSESTGKLTEGP